MEFGLACVDSMYSTKPFQALANYLSRNIETKRAAERAAIYGFMT
jgi:hypothetical protein